MASALSSYCPNPAHVKFIGTDKHEKIILLLRKHPITNIPWIATSIFMALIPLIIFLTPMPTMLPEGYQIVGVLFWYLIVMAYTLEKFITWFFNVYIVTDERIFDVDFHNLVYREISDANIDQIQDVTVIVGSVIRTTLDYGDVIIQTAAEIVQLDFHAVPHPDRVAKILRELRVEEETEKIEGRVR